jgi:beta-lactamase class A
MRFVILFSFVWTTLAMGESLGRRIERIAAEAHGKVAVACSVPGCALHAHSRPPMQSVFKLPMAMAMLARVERGEFKLDQPVRFLPSDRILPQTYSPLQDKYPNGDVDVPLRDLLQAAVMLSDNTASDIVLRILGGPKAVTAYIHGLGVRGFHLEDNEATLHRERAAQYRNWFEPDAAVRFLLRLQEKSPLNDVHTKMLLGWMRDSPTGAKRIKGLLPEGVGVMHKTGTSGTHGGVTEATNDIGIIPLPTGKALVLAVFVTDAKAAPAEIEAVIARIAKAAYEEAAKR